MQFRLVIPIIVVNISFVPNQIMQIAELIFADVAFIQSNIANVLFPLPGAYMKKKKMFRAAPQITEKGDLPAFPSSHPSALAKFAQI